tara:strand:- start:52 stop:510 length:459 start_codon:yes stop_codon:yes gene_type:complete
MVETANRGGAGSRIQKSASAFRTISEASSELNIPAHVLRFWESKFSQVNPVKRAGGRRYYRREDIILLGRIRDLLYVDGYTIKGVQKLFRKRGAPKPKLDESETVPSRLSIETNDMTQHENPSPTKSGKRAELKQILRELEDIRAILRKEKL